MPGMFSELAKLDNWSQWSIAPMAIVFAGAVATTLIAGFVKDSTRRSFIGQISIFCLAIAAAVNYVQWTGGWQDPGRLVWAGSMTLDYLTMLMNFVFIGCAILAILISLNTISELGIEYGEFYPLILFATGGMMCMVQATDLLMIFIGLEVMSIPLYIMCGMRRSQDRSAESSLKYFILGALAAGFLLYGVALTYGATGVTSLHGIQRWTMENGGLAANPLLTAGLALILAGFAFKIALAPFHMWTPDVYEGAPTFVTAFMSAAVKAAGFVTLFRILVTGFFQNGYTASLVGWGEIIAILAVLTMTIGNFSALVTKNVKRMLAWSSVAHAGYAAVGLAAAPAAGADGVGGVLFYVIGYALTSFVSFGVVAAFEKQNGGLSQVEDYRGLGYSQPFYAFAMTVAMFALAGIPPTVGFLGKWYVFKAAVEANITWLAVIGVLNSLVSVYYYLRVVVAMYLESPEEQAEQEPIKSSALWLAVLISTVLTIGVGLFPKKPLGAVEKSVSPMFVKK
ncbi:MAG: NAD(P)H-quinone oxidoreductase subunit 2, chloroplastic [Myxococcota bacterium]|nr:NAD(P)H-quinone oxidoreductase subunit 2, chloroplastic [Myxococcota bacterium]